MLNTTHEHSVYIWSKGIQIRIVISVALTIIVCAATSIRPRSIQAAGQTWMQISPIGGLPAGNAATLAGFDANTDRMIVFGGAVNNANEIWVLTHADGLGGASQWIKLTPLPDPVSGFPAARGGNSVVYDSISNRMMIFGGCLGNCLPIVNDMWVLTNANGLGGAPAWIKLSPAGSTPAPRASTSAVYDSGSNTMIVFGGQNGCCFPPLTFGEVWLLGNANGLGGTPVWTQLSTSGGPPPGQASATAVYDPASNRLTVFGGFPLFSRSPSNAVWVLSNANGLGGPSVWTNLIPEGAAGSPPARADHTAVYDATTNQMIIFAGRIPGITLYNDTWMLTNANGAGTPGWTQLFPTCGPPAARLAAVAVLNTSSSRMTVFGGETDSGILTDTWVLNTAQSGACPPPSSGVCIPPPSGLVGWWPGDGNANDIIGGNSGTLVGGVTFATGEVGQAFSLNGTNASVQVPNNTSLLLGTGEITVDAWIKTPPWNGSNPPSGVRTIVGKSNPVYPYQAYFLRTNVGSGTLVRVEFVASDCGTGACGFSDVGGGGIKQPVRSVTVVGDDRWHHVAGVRRADGTREIWVDGILENIRFESMWNTDSNNPLFLGQLDGTNNYLFTGLVDEVEVFNRALSASEIQAIFNAGSAGKCKNRPPVALCRDVTVSAGSSCAANASIDSGSFDPDTGDTISLSQSPPGPYPLGNTPVTLTVTDSHGASSQCIATVTVVDKTPPTIRAASASPSLLWPPNHKMVDVTVNYVVTDNCDPASSVRCDLTVSSNEPPDGVGDGHTSADWQVIDAHHVQLRAERSGGGNGRIYTITITCRDSSGNSSSQSITVSVPHDQGQG